MTNDDMFRQILEKLEAIGEDADHAARHASASVNERIDKLDESVMGKLTEHDTRLKAVEERIKEWQISFKLAPKMVKVSVFIIVGAVILAASGILKVEQALKWIGGVK